MLFSIGVVMDPIQSINIKKDSTFAMMLEAQKRGWPVWYMEQQDLFLEGGKPYARMRRLWVEDQAEAWFSFGEEQVVALGTLDVILMRKDPPFDMEYIYTTYLLEKAEAAGTLLVNRPQALRDGNEKLLAGEFPQCCVDTLVTRHPERLLDFIAKQGDTILKPLDGMGGASIYRVAQGDPNTNVIIELMTRQGTAYTMAQRFIPEICEGDKRILMIAGQPVSYALARIPKLGETRGNLAAGARAEALPLSDRDRWIARQVGPYLVEQGILFAGLDVIGDYLTEVNITSPTCIRELDRQCGLNISAMMWDAVVVCLKQRKKVGKCEAA